VRILVAGRLAGVRQGGASWAVLQYVLGLRRLGHDVAVWDPAPDPDYLAELVERFDLQVGTEAHLLLNLSGVLRDERVLARIPVRAYVDLDPGFTQLWHEQGQDVGLDGHTHFVTVGQALGRPDCAVPTCGVSWITTLPPVDLSSWPQVDGPGGVYSTVGNWRSYGSITVGGVHIGQRAHSMRPLFELPRRVEPRFAVALAIDAAETSDLEALHRCGWELLDPLLEAGTPSRYRDFVQRSRAEISIAKSGYVISRCGWFSDRSACYLASGRPVVAQDTGLGNALPTGRGLLLFRELDEAVAAIEEVERDYEAHATGARKLAIDHFDARGVLRRLLEQIGLS
jgi:hypothetical protein